MTAGDRILAALLAAPGTAAGNKIRKDAADERDTYPFIIFRRVNVERITGLNNTLLAAKETFHVECWGGQRRAESDALEEQALALILAAGLYSDGNEPDGLDPEVKVRAAVFLVDVWITPSLTD